MSLTVEEKNRGFGTSVFCVEGDFWDEDLPSKEKIETTYKLLNNEKLKLKRIQKKEERF